MPSRMQQTTTIKEMLRNNSRNFSSILAFQIKRDEKFVKYTHGDVGAYASGLIARLKELGIQKGDKIALISENRPEWSVSYLAIASMGAIVVPLDALGAEYDIKGIIQHSESKGLIASDKFIDMVGNAPSLKFRISLDKDFPGLKDRASNDLGYDVATDDLAAIVYTSGTTGVPKGVMLTHGNITSNVAAACSMFDIGPTDSMLSVLPLHHTFECTGGFFAPYSMGASVTTAESLKSFKLLNNMNEVHPTILIGVPMLYQLFYDGLRREVDEKGPIFKVMFKTLNLISLAFRTLLRVNIGRFLFGTVHKKFGGKFRFWVSGGAAIDPDLLNDFDLMGFTIIQGYGLTESSPVITANNLENNRYGSVGRPIPGVCIKLVDGEVVASGPNIMKGYFKMPEETAKVLKNGWLFTGDIGRIDKDGYLYITGRSKDVIISSSGLNVYPDEIEFELNKIPFIKESCVIGRKLKTGIKKGSEEVFAVVAPNIEYFQKLGLSTEENSVFNAIFESVEKLNERIPMYKRVSGIEVRYTEFPKTSTKKIKRYAVRKEMEHIWQS